jgi:exosortase/archaeosortase family protein
MSSLDLRHPLVRFALIMGACFVAWFVVYDLWLAPDGRLDAFLALNLAAIVGGLIDLAGGEVTVDGRFVGMAGAIGVLVVDDCNGLSSLGLFLAFVLAYPGRWQRRMWFIPAGLAFIFAINAARILTLVLVQRYAEQWFDPLHQYGTAFLYYLAIFGLWVLWARYGGGPAGSLVPSRARSEAVATAAV